MVNDKTITEQSDDTTALIKSLLREAEHTIQELQRQGDLREKEIRDAASETLKQYEDDIKNRNDIKLHDMLAKLRHRHELDKEKRIMKIIESFIDDSIKNTINAIHAESPQIYHEYLKERVDSIRGITGSNPCIIFFRKEDDSIITSLLSNRASGDNESGAVSLQHDDGIIYGGIRVFDRKEGIYYEGTLDRAIFRKREEIRTALHEIIIAFITQRTGEGS